MRTYGEALADGRAALTTRDLAGGARDARLLLAHAAGFGMTDVIARAGEPIPAEADIAYAAALARRILARARLRAGPMLFSGTPVSRLMSR